VSNFRLRFSPSLSLSDIHPHHTYIGTMLYMAPERLEGKQYNYAADMWSFGLTLFTLANGKFPFANSRGFWELAQIVKDKPIPTLDPKRFSSGLIDLCERCMQKDPSKRPSASEMLRHPFLTKASMARSIRLRRRSGKSESGLEELKLVAKKLSRYYNRVRKHRKRRRQRRTMSAPPLRDSRRLRRSGGKRLPKLVQHDEDSDEEEEELCRRNVKHLAIQLDVSMEDAVFEFEKVGIRVESQFKYENRSDDLGVGFRESERRKSNSRRYQSGMSKISEDDHHHSRNSSSVRLPKL